MGKNQSASGLTNVIQYSNGNITFVSGSTTLMSISSSGAITTTGVISGSNALSASYAANADTLDGLDSTVFTLTSSFNAQTASFTAFSSSILAQTASLNAFSASILSFTASQNITNGTFTLTSSFNAQTASFTAFTASILAQTASLNAFSASVLTFTGSASTRLGALEAATGSLYSYTSSLNNKTASFATTGSNTFIGNQVVSGSIVQSGSFTTTGTIIAQTINVQTVTSSIIYSSGSNIFGNALNDSQKFTGSVLITGSLTIAGAATFSNTVTAAGNIVGTGIFSNGDSTAAAPNQFQISGVANDNKQLLIGYNTSGSGYGSIQPIFQGVGYTNLTLNPSGGNVGIGIINPSYTFDVCKTVAGDFVARIANPSSTGYGLYVQANDNTKAGIRIANASGGTAIDLFGSGAATFSSTITGTTIYGSTAVCSPVGKFTSCIDAGTGYFSGNINANNISTTSRTMTGSPVSTGLSINGGGGGRTYLLLTSQQWDAGNATSSAITMIRSGYDGNNFTACVLSSSNLPTETWSQSGGILHVTGLNNYQLDLTVLNNS